MRCNVDCHLQRRCAETFDYYIERGVNGNLLLFLHDHNFGIYSSLAWRDSKLESNTFSDLLFILHIGRKLCEQNQSYLTKHNIIKFGVHFYINLPRTSTAVDDYYSEIYMQAVGLDVVR